VSRAPGRVSTARIWRVLAGTFAGLVILAALVHIALAGYVLARFAGGPAA